MVSCGYCQTQNSDEARFCYRCGVGLSQYVPSQPAAYTYPTDVAQQAISLLDQMWSQLSFQERFIVVGLLPHALYRTHWAEQRLKQWINFRARYDPRMYGGR